MDYDAPGKLVYGDASQTRFDYVGTQFVAEYGAGGQLLRRYVPGVGTDEPLVWYEGTGTANRRWLHADERGSIVKVSNEAGATLRINAYDEYGIPQSTNIGRFQYTGQTWLPELGMIISGLPRTAMIASSSRATRAPDSDVS